MNRCILILLLLLLPALAATGQEGPVLKLQESRVQAKVPRRLRTMQPWWGVPVSESPSAPADVTDCESFFACRPDSTALPRWVCWNIDLAAAGEDRYKHERLFPKGFNPPCAQMLRLAVDQAFKWAWRKPYGTTCVVVGAVRSSWFVAICKKETVSYPQTLEFSSIAFSFPEDAVAFPGSIYKYSQSVNRVENLCGYNLFPKLPAYCQEQVEEMTTYELFCPFKEPDENVVELEIEFEREYEGIEQTRE